LNSVFQFITAFWATQLQYPTKIWNITCLTPCLKVLVGHHSIIGISNISHKRPEARSATRTLVQSMANSCSFYIHIYWDEK
jgi:hypothetical protein